jgi:AcrR family transcriptional regulator
VGSLCRPYHHFESREQLLAAIAVEGFTLLVSEMKNAALEAGDASSIDASAELEALGRGYIRFALAHRGHFRVMFRPELREELGPELAETLGEGLVMLRRAVVRCQEAGTAPKGDSEPLVLLAWSVVHGASTLWIDGSLGDVRLVQDAEGLARTVPLVLTRLLADSTRPSTPR